MTPTPPDDNTRLKLAAARNTATPLNTLIDLSTDENRDVRTAAYENPATQSAFNIVKNHRSTPQALEKIGLDTPTEIRHHLALNQSTPPHMLARLASDPSDDVRLAAARHPATPLITLILLASDNLYAVKATARGRLQNIDTLP